MTDTEWAQPSPAQMSLALASLAPWKLLARPVFYGIDRIPDERPLLFVGNHTLYGLLDAPFMAAELYEKRGMWLRGLGDFAHFEIPVWGQFLRHFGVVPGTREICAKLMRNKECIGVFPGGARETIRLHGERYKLDWRDRTGFARMAVEHGCTIVPFSAIGVDDAFTFWLDREEIMAIKPVANIIKRFNKRPEVIWPVPKTFRPERLYFAFGEPIRTDQFKGVANDDNVNSIRDLARDAILEGIDFLQAERDQDRDRHLGAHAIHKLADLLDGA